MPGTGDEALIDDAPTTGPFRVFVSYRRDDSPGHAGRLYDTLKGRLPQAELFMDVDNIEPGLDFVESINTAVGACDVLLALIGPKWAGETTNGTRRLEEPGDFVRLELEAALRRDIRVIPVLFRDANMPRPEELPESIQGLTRRNAIHIADDRWRSDAERLVAALEKMVPTTDPRAADDVPTMPGAEGDRSGYQDSVSSRLRPATTARQRRPPTTRAFGRSWLREGVRTIGLLVAGIALVAFGLALGYWVILPLLG